MAVRFDASGEAYSRTLGLGSVSAFTVSMWVRLASDRALSTILWQIDNGSADWLTVRAWDGTGLAIETDGEWNALLGQTLTVGTWCYVGIGAQTSGSVNKVIGNAGGSLIAANSNFGATTFTAGTLRIGVGGSPTGWLDGSEAAVKIWSGVQLTTDELELEAWTYTPRRISNLTAWYPFLTPSTVDYSGNGQTLSGGAGATTDDGPPIAWRSRRINAYIPLPASTPIILTETGTGDDQIAVDAAAGLVETAAAADDLTAAAVTTLTEDVTATDALTIDVATALTETVSGTDDLTGGVPVSLDDSATATDDLNAVPAPVLDEPVAGTDVLAVTATAGLADTVTGADVLAVSEVLFKTLADTVTVTDALSILIQEDVAISAAGLRRGWAAQPLAAAWDANGAARGWTARQLMI